MHTIFYLTPIRKRGPLGIGYVSLKLRTAHVDERKWLLLRGRPFSIRALLA